MLRLKLIRIILRITFFLGEATKSEARNPTLRFVEREIREIFPFIPLGLLIVGKPIFYLITLPFNILYNLAKLITRVVLSPFRFISFIIRVLFVTPYRLLRLVGRLPLRIAEFTFDVITRICGIPLRFVRVLARIAYHIFLIITYIPRLPFIVLFKFPGFKLIPIIFTKLYTIFVTIGELFCGSIINFIRFLITYPARIFIFILNGIKFVVLLPIRILLFPFFCISLLIRLITLPIRLLTLPIRLVVKLVRLVIYDFILNVVFGIISIFARLISFIRKLLSIPKNIIDFFYF